MGRRPQFPRRGGCSARGRRLRTAQARLGGCARGGQCGLPPAERATRRHGHRTVRLLVPRGRGPPGPLGQPRECPLGPAGPPHPRPAPWAESRRGGAGAGAGSALVGAGRARPALWGPGCGRGGCRRLWARVLEGVGLSAACCLSMSTACSSAYDFAGTSPVSTVCVSEGLGVCPSVRLCTCVSYVHV